MENVLLAITWCLPVHGCSIVYTPICNQSITFSTAAMHFPNTHYLIDLTKCKNKSDTFNIAWSKSNVSELKPVLTQLT